MSFPPSLSTKSSGNANILTHEVFYFDNVDVLYNDRTKKYGTSACNKVNVGAVVGGAVGGLLLLIGCGAGAYLYSKKG